MSDIRILAIDIGAGTQDILLYDSRTTIENCVKLILPSQTTILAGRIARATAAGRDIFLTGQLMGGGPCVRAIKRHLRQGFRVYATPQAAKTIRDNPAEVRELGVRIVDVPPDGDVLVLETKDVDLEALRAALAPFDVTLPEEYAIAVQDHGETLEGSQRRFRFRHWREFVRQGGELARLIYAPGETPSYLTRMLAVQETIPAAWVMDTGAAAFWGALCDPQVAAHRDEGLVIVNVGNQHTIGALVQGERIWGLFEHHTAIVDTARIGSLVEELQNGTLQNEVVYGENGHGAYIDPAYPGGFGFVAITGPQRHLARGLGYYEAAPYGDMMLSGAFGLVAAFLHRRGLPMHR